MQALIVDTWGYAIYLYIHKYYIYTVHTYIHTIYILFVQNMSGIFCTVFSPFWTHYIDPVYPDQSDSPL